MFLSTHAQYDKAKPPLALLRFPSEVKSGCFWRVPNPHNLRNDGSQGRHAPSRRVPDRASHARRFPLPPSPCTLIAGPRLAHSSPVQYDSGKEGRELLAAECIRALSSSTASNVHEVLAFRATCIQRWKATQCLADEMLPI